MQKLGNFKEMYFLSINKQLNCKAILGQLMAGFLVALLMAAKFNIMERRGIEPLTP